MYLNRNNLSTMTHLLILLVLVQYSTSIPLIEDDEKSLLSQIMEKELESRETPTQLSVLTDSGDSASTSASSSPSSNEENMNLLAAVMGLNNKNDAALVSNDNKNDHRTLVASVRKTHRNRYLTDPTHDGPLQRKSAKKRFKLDRNLQRVEKKSWNLPTQTLGHYLEIKEQAKQTARKANELRKLLNSINDI